MKKMLNKSNIFSFLLGVLLCGSIVSAATLIDSKDVTYTPNNSNFNANSVESALDKLYEKATGLPKYVFGYVGFYYGGYGGEAFFELTDDSQYTPLMHAANSSYSVSNDYVDATGYLYNYSITTKVDCKKVANNTVTDISANTTITISDTRSESPFLLIFE